MFSKHKQTLKAFCSLYSTPFTQLVSFSWFLHLTTWEQCRAMCCPHYTAVSSRHQVLVDLLLLLVLAALGEEEHGSSPLVSHSSLTVRTPGWWFGGLLPLGYIKPQERNTLYIARGQMRDTQNKSLGLDWPYDHHTCLYMWLARESRLDFHEVKYSQLQCQRWLTLCMLVED